MPDQTHASHESRIFGRGRAGYIVPWLDRISKWILYANAFLIPLFVLQIGSMDLSRATVFGVSILISCGLQLVKFLLVGTFSYTKSPLNSAVLALVVVAAASTFFSSASSAAFGYTDVIGERFFSIVLYALVYALAISVLRGKNDSIIFMLWLVAGGALWGIMSFVQYFGVYLPFDAAKRIDFNPVGTLNSLALFYGFLTMVVSGVLLSIRKHAEVRGLRIGLWIAFAIFLLNLIVINFTNAWILFLISAILLTWLFMHASYHEGGHAGDGIRGKSFYFLIALLIIPVLFIFIRVPLFSAVQIPLEVSPSFMASVDIAQKVMKQGILQAALGVGPGTFAYAYGAFHDQAINLTNFWGVRFGQGYSFLVTSLATMGILGFLALLSVILTAVYAIGRSVVKYYSYHPLVIGIVSGAAFLVLGLILYPANFTLLLITFAVLGFAVNLTSEHVQGRFFGIRDATFESPWAIFLSSLLSVFLLGLVIGGVYYSIQRYRAAISVERGVEALQRTGDLEGAITLLDKATSLDAMNDQYQRFVAQARLLKVQNILNSALSSNPPATVQADFQREVAATIASVQHSIQLNPLESFNVRTAGSVYQTLIPFVPGANQSAVNAYARAAQLDPMNPLVFSESAQAYMIIADTAQSLADQPKVTAEQAKEYKATRSQALDTAAQFLSRSIELKSDFATGHFLLAQVALRQGKTAEAIKNTENARNAASQDIGILFQLGLLYYQNKDFDDAEKVFSQALVLNPNYSNARYFLGLILDKRGEKSEAIKHFEQILVLNPGNTEVQKILVNLRAGKAALTGITPAPEKGREAPVKEDGGKEKTPIKPIIKKK